MKLSTFMSKLIVSITSLISDPCLLEYSVSLTQVVNTGFLKAPDN